MKEEPKTAAKHLFEERYLVAVLCNVRMPQILLLVKKSPGLKPGRAGLIFKVISLNWSVCPYWAINFWFSARYVKNCAFNIFILTRVPTSNEGPQWGSSIIPESQPKISCNPEGYFWHPPPVHNFNPETRPKSCFQIPNRELQVRESLIPGNLLGPSVLDMIGMRARSELFVFFFTLTFV